MGTTLVQTSLVPRSIAQPKRHLNTFICLVSSIHVHMCGCLSNIINNIFGGLLRMGHQFIPTCVSAQTITAIMQLTSIALGKR